MKNNSNRILYSVMEVIYVIKPKSKFEMMCGFFVRAIGRHAAASEVVIWLEQSKNVFVF